MNPAVVVDKATTTPGITVTVKWQAAYGGT